MEARDHPLHDSILSREVGKDTFKKICEAKSGNDSSPPAGRVPVTLEAFSCPSNQEEDSKKGGGNVEVTLIRGMNFLPSEEHV